MRAIRADKGAQLRLLDLQTVDTKLTQLHHRRQTLPQHATIAKLRTERAAVASDLVAAETRISDLELEQAKAETDLEPVRERLSRDQARITNGAVADPKALSSMLEEVNHLKKRISDLEDAELEVMEQLETAMASQDRLRARAAQVDADIDEAMTERDRQLAALDAEMGGLREQRAEICWPSTTRSAPAVEVSVQPSCGPVAARAASSRSMRPSYGLSQPRPMTRSYAARSAAGF
jgi:predicted  nucleic acid-binding Zn-ribbon protein